MYLTGGCGALYDGASPDGSKNQTSITRVHQAFGRNYQLPNATAHNETCANIGNVLWNWRMFLASGDAQVRGCDGVGPLQLRALGRRPRWQRLLLHQPAPTTGQGVRGASVVAHPRAVYDVVLLSSERGAYDRPGRRLRLWQIGTYHLGQSLRQAASSTRRWRTGRESNSNNARTIPGPATSRSRCIECDLKPMDLKLRIPGWAKSAELKVDGVPAEETLTPGAYVSLRRSWRPGAKIDLSIAMPPRLIESHPLVEETRNEVAVKRGPVVYCLESVLIFRAASAWRASAHLRIRNGNLVLTPTCWKASPSSKERWRREAPATGTVRTLPRIPTT